jgi:hypothetical protein
MVTYNRFFETTNVLLFAPPGDRDVGAFGSRTLLLFWYSSSSLYSFCRFDFLSLPPTTFFSSDELKSLKLVGNDDWWGAARG